MERDFKLLQEYISSKTLKMKKPLLADTVYNFKFYLNCTNYECDQIIGNMKHKSEWLILYQTMYLTEKYLIFCFDKNIIIINEKHNDLLNYLLKRIKNYTVYLLRKNNESIQETIDFLEKNEIFDVLYDDKFFQSEINSFLEDFLALNKGISKIWDILKRPISAYLIKLGHYKLAINRTDHHNFYFKQVTHHFKEKLTENDFVNLIYLKSNPMVILIYYIEKECLYVFKTANTREYDNYQHIFHPLIPRCYGKASLNDIEGILIEYIDGKDLNCIQKKKVEMIVKYKIIFKIMIVIEYLHNQNYIYRDLKPQNLIIDKFNNIVLIDFDSMVINNDQLPLKDYTALFGNFLSPELTNGKPYSYSTDVYSIGQIIYFIFSNEFQQIKQNLNHDVYLNKLYQLYKKCVENDQNKRPTMVKLINDFFINIYSILTDQCLNWQNLNNIDNMHTNKYNKFWFYIAEFDHPDCQYSLFNIFYYEQKVYKDDCMLFKCSIKAAKGNNINVLNNVGYLYSKGIGCQMDIEKAIYYLSLAAEKGHELAQCNLGFLFMNIDLNKADFYFSLAVEYNNPEILTKIGIQYLYFFKNINKAIEYFKRAADQKHIIAEIILCDLYSDGVYINKDISKAEKYYSLIKSCDFTYSVKDSEKLDWVVRFFLQWGDYENCIRYLRQAANLKHIKACNILGQFYEKGEIIEKNIQKSIEYYKIAAEGNDTYSQSKLGLFYYDGKVVPKDIYKAIYYFNKARHEDSFANFFLGLIYINGTYVQQNIKLGLKYLYDSASQNNGIAYGYLGCLYYLGEYVTKNIDKAICYFTKAVSLDAICYAYNLGLIYKEMNNDQKAIEYLLIATKNEENSKSAYNELGHLYLKSYNIPRDVNRSIYYYSQAKEKGLFSLGIIYLEGKYVEQDIKKAINYFEQSIKYNPDMVFSFYQLGAIYYEGKYVKRDINKAITYFSSVKFNKISNCYLGLIYFNGIDVKRDINKGIQYLIHSANDGYFPAQKKLAKIYENGQYIEKDIKKAINYYELAAKNRHVKSMFKTAVFYHQGKHIEKNMSKAIFYYKECSTLNNIYAKNNLGLIYKYGEGTIKNMGNAIEYFNELIKMHDGVAMYNLAHIYFYGEYVDVDLNKSISLLINSAHYGKMTDSMMLLAIALIKKYKFVSKEFINDELKSSGINSNYARSELFKIIKKTCSNLYKDYDYGYNYYKDVDYFYIDYGYAECTKNFYGNKTYKNAYSNIKNIEHNFYEGFGI